MHSVAIAGICVLAAFALFLLWRESLLGSVSSLGASLVLLVVAFGLRAISLDHQTLDYVNFLSRWIDYFRENGGISALSGSIGNYNLPYLYFLAVFSYTSDVDLYLIKFLSIFFDILLAWSSLKLVSVFSQSKKRKMAAFFTVLLMPTVLLNGAYWGQCDSIYTAFAVFSIYCALANRPVFSMISIALSFAFKLQAVFIMPVFIILLFTQRIKIWHFFLFPLTYIVAVTPAVILNRPFIETISLYFNQAGSVGDGLNYNSPSVFSFVRSGSDVYFLANLGIAAAFAFVAIMLLWFFIKRKHITNELVLIVTLVFAIGIPFLLPHMHDRYFFPADVFSVILAISFPVFFPIPFLASFASLLGYHAYLRMEYLWPMSYGATALIAALAFLLVTIIKKTFSSPSLLQ